MNRLLALLLGVLGTISPVSAGYNGHFLEALYAPPKYVSSSARAASPTKIVKIEVPFTTQAPSGNWSDPRFQNGCEEAALIMAAAWANAQALPSPTLVEEQIYKLADFQELKYDTYKDTSAKDTAALLVQYFLVPDVQLIRQPTVNEISEALKAGRIVIVPTNGQRLLNPNYRNGGPLTHMLVITGYDLEKDEFVTNDPGTRQGHNYRYKTKVLMAALQDYPTGHHLTQQFGETAAIVVSRQ